MYCSKCGTKAIDGAAFCQKCGAKLIQGHGEKREAFPVSIQESMEKPIPSGGTSSEPEQKSAKDDAVLKSEPIQVSSQEPIKKSTVPVEAIIKTTQKADIPKKPSSTLGSDADIYELLKENIGRCPVIKSAKQVKKGVRLRGRIYSHTVRLVTVHTVQARIRSILAFPLSILYGLLAGLLCAIGVVVLQELVKYGSICIEYYHGILFSLCCLAMGAIALIHAFVGCKEKGAVEIYVREALKTKQIYLSKKKWISTSKIKFVEAFVLIVASIVVLPFSLPNLMDSLEYPDELLFDGLPATRFLEMTQEDIESEVGESVSVPQNMITNDDYYNYYDGIEHVVYSKKTGKVIYVQLEASRCSCNGITLGKSSKQVLDILSKRYPGSYYSYGIYGSIHNGFYYDGTYFGEIPSSEEILSQMEFEDNRDSNYYFIPLQAYGEEYYDSNWSLNGRKKQDYKIDLITHVHKTMDDLNGVYEVCLYTDEWVETVNTAKVPHEQDYTSDSSNMGGVLYDGLPVSQFFALSADELVEILGTPVDYNEYTLIYDDIEFWLDNGKITSAESFATEKFTIDGVTLDKRQNELKELLGNPSNEEDGGSGYQLEFSLEGCRLVIAVDEDVAWRIWVLPPEYQSGESGYNAIDLSYRGESIANWIGGLPENAYDVFGWPDSGTIVDGYLYEGGEYFGYTDGVLFVMDYQTGQIGWIIGDTSSIIGNGYTLDKTRDELIEILGTPMMEEYAYNDMDDTSSYYMQYTLNGAELLINMPDSASRAETVIISQIVE